MNLVWAVIPLVFMIFVVGISGEQNASALAPCYPPGGEMQFNSNDEIFTAYVIDKEIMDDHTKVNFEVNTIFKGNPDSKHHVIIPENDWDHYVMGTEVFFLYKINSEGEKYNEWCDSHGNGHKIPFRPGHNNSAHESVNEDYSNILFYLSELNLDSPLEQQASGKGFEYLDCRFHLIPVLLNSGSFACVTDTSKKILTENNMIKDFDYGAIMDVTEKFLSLSGDVINFTSWSDDSENEYNYSALLQYSAYEGSGINITIEPSTALGNKRIHDVYYDGRFLFSIPSWMFEHYYFDEETLQYSIIKGNFAYGKIIDVENDNVILEMDFVYSEAGLSIGVKQQ
ncbi:MAG: hypothetical protein J4F36_12990 [Nitrosopumilaceae archaeon]|nr:hypothetical protein [Nitrosopumilaceae archaeon]